MEKKFVINGQEVIVQDFQSGNETVSFKLNQNNYSYRLIDRKGPELILEGEARLKAFVASPNLEGESMIMANGHEAIIGLAGKKMKKAGVHAGSLTSPMPGKIFKIVKDAGSEVKKGEVILILEAMKMEHSIRSDKDGKVKKILYKTGDLVQGGVVLAEVE